MSEERDPPPSPSPAAGRAGQLWKLAVGVVLATAFLYLFLRGADFYELGQALLRARPRPLALAVGVAVFSFWIRAERWRCYLQPVRDPGTRSSFEIMMIGYMTSNFVPGRVGDFVVRPALMSRDERIPAATTLATIAVERLFDAIAVVSMFALYVALWAPPTLATLGKFDLAQLQVFGWLMLAVCGAGIAFLVGLRMQRRRMLSILAMLLRPLPDRLQARVLLHADSFADGLNLFADASRTIKTVAYTVAAWIATALSMWLVAVSMGLTTLRAADGLYLIGLGAVGVAIPAPGGVGSFHYLMRVGLESLAVQPRETAQAGAIMIWALTWIPINVLGLAALLRRGVRLRELEADGH